MMEYLEPLLTWISANPGWAGAVLFLIACGESLAFVGLIVPGAVLMFGAGALIAAGRLELLPMLLWAAAGAVVGDGISFGLGRYFDGRLAGMWPFSRYPRLFERGVAFFERHGGKSVLMGRFVGPIRPIIPAVAGMLGMPAGRFFLVNVLSALLWAPAYLLPGMAFAASFSLAAEVMTRLLILVAAAVGLAWLFYWLTHRSLRLTLAAIFSLILTGLVLAIGVDLWRSRAQWDPALSVSQVEWQAAPWQVVPSRRLGIWVKEPFELQLVGPYDELVAAVTAEDWRLMDPTDLSALLSWLSPEVDPLRLAPVPHLHLGRLPNLVAVKVVAEDRRWVLRVWRSALTIGREDRPLWLATLERERLTPGLLWVRSEATAEEADTVRTLIAELLGRLPGRVGPPG